MYFVSYQEYCTWIESYQSYETSFFAECDDGTVAPIDLNNTALRSLLVKTFYLEI